VWVCASWNEQPLAGIPPQARAGEGAGRPDMAGQV
jgi:hypothetical protein